MFAKLRLRAREKILELAEPVSPMGGGIDPEMTTLAVEPSQ
jgi:hypothetical protein